MGGVRPDGEAAEAGEHLREAERDKSHSNIVLGPRRLNGVSVIRTPPEYAIETIRRTRRIQNAWQRPACL